METAQFNFDPAKILMAIIILLLIMVLVSTCQTNLQLNKDIEQFSEQKGGFTKRIYSDSLILYSQELNIIGLKTINEKLKKDLKRLKLSNPKEIVKIQTKTVVKTEIELGDPVYIDSFPHLRLPRFFSKQDRWFSISGNINRLGLLQIDSIVSLGNFTYAVGDSSRKGFISKILGTRDKVVRLSIDNPNIALVGFSNVYIRQERKWWQKRGVAFAFGALFGGGLMLYAAK
jgi:hypothetical protein